MIARRRLPKILLGLFLLSLPLVGLAIYSYYSPIRQAGWSTIGLPGSRERIANFPELVKLSENETRPATDLPAPAFKLDATPGTAVSPTVERQRLLDADSFAPRAPQTIAADFGARQNPSDAERDALVEAYLDLGRIDEAIAARRAQVQRAASDDKAHEALIGLLDRQNRIDDLLPAIDVYFSLLLEKGREADSKKREKALERVQALLDQRQAVSRRALKPQTDNDAARLRLLDAFPQSGEPAAAYARDLLAAGRYDDLIATFEPRVDRYEENRDELWDLLTQAYEKRGRLDPLIRRLESLLAARDSDALLEIYGRVLQRANLVEPRRKELAAALQAAPDFANLRALIHLDLSVWRYEPARATMIQFLPRVAAGATAAQLLSLSDLAQRAGLPDEAATLAADGALLAGGDTKLLLAAATRLDRGAAAVAWPLAISPAQAFQPAFADRAPGVVGGLLSLGANRQEAPEALRHLPAAGGRYVGRHQAVRLAYRVLELAPEAETAFAAAHLIAGVYREIQEAERLERLAAQFIARFGEGTPQIGRVLQWRADAAQLRRNTGAEIEALRQAYEAALRVDRPADARELESRLIALLLKEKRYPDVLGLKWTRVERYPQDEEAMRDLLKFAEDNKLFADEERAYRQAIERFDRRAWSDKFARWLLRQKRQQDFQALVLDAAAKLGESDLSRFMQDLVGEKARQSAGDLFFEKAYIVALDRFPADLEMNRRLLDFYERRGWDNNGQVAFQDKFIDLGLRLFALDADISRRLVQRLAQRHMLAGLQQRLAANTAPRPVELLLWTHIQEHAARYEAARQGYAALDAHWPGSRRATLPLATVTRSLADSFYVRDASLYAGAAEAYGRLADRQPLDTEYRTLQGETLIEAGRPREAATAWESSVAATPGDAERWLELATLYWDYYRPAEAKNVIAEARQTLSQPELFAKEMAYLLEDEGQIAAAVDELTIVVLTRDYSGDMYEAGRRLDYLTRAKKTTSAAVDAAFWRRLERSAGKSEEGLAYLDWLRERNRVEPAKTAAYRLLPRYTDTVFAEGANELFAAHGDQAGVKACLERLVAISNRDPVMIQRLVVHHENRREFAAADKLVKELVDRAATESARDDAREFAAAYFWRTDRHAAAIDYYRLLAAEGSAYSRQGRWIVYADRCLEDNRPDDALTALTELRRNQPTDPTIVGAMAKAHAAKNDRAALVSLYQTVLGELRDAKLSSDTKKAREIELRGKLIDALTAMGRPRDAIEEHIKIVNRLAPDPTPVLAAFRYAQRYNQIAPLLEYYERETKRAHRDFRWQTVTALIYEGQGRYPEAAAMLDKAIANEPQRLDLLEKRAQVLIKAGDFDGAIAVYKTLDSRRLTGADYQLRIAEVLYLAKRPEQAEKWLDQTLAANDIAVARVIAAARLADRFNRAFASRAYAARAMSLILAQPDRQAADGDFYWLWLRGVLETGGVGQAVSTLDSVRGQLRVARESTHPVGRKAIDQTLAQLDGLSTGALASWLGQHADGPAREAAAALLQSLLTQGIPGEPGKQQGAYDKAVAAARAAQLPTVADALRRAQLGALDAQLANTDEPSKFDEQFAKLLRRHGASQSLAALLADALAQPAAGGQTASLTEQAILARAAGDARETELLARLYGPGPEKQLRWPTPLQARYFGLLGDAQLDALINGDFARPGPLTVWLAGRGQTARLIAALTHHYGDRDPRWLLATKALAYEADPAFAPQARAANAELLGLPLQIAGLLAAKPAAGQVSDNLWTRYARKYSGWLLSRGDLAGLPLAYAEPERHPLSASAYLNAAAGLDLAGRYREAETFLAQAAQLSDDDELVIARALHLYRQGKSGQAADRLEALIAKPDAPLAAVRQYAELMARIDRGKAGLERWTDILRARLPKLPAYARRDAIGEWLAFARQNQGDSWTAREVREPLADPLFSSADLRSLIDGEALPPALLGWAWSLVLDRADNDARLTVYARRSFAEAALTHALTVRDKDLARLALRFLATNDPTALQESEWRLQRLRAAVYFESIADAEALADRFVRETTDQKEVETALRIFENENRPDAAARLWLAYYEPIRRDTEQVARWENYNDLVATPVSALFVADLRGLAAFLRLKNEAAATERAIELEEAAGEDAGGLIALAQVLREAGRFEPAVRLAAKAATLEPSDPGVQSQRILIHLAAGQAEEAARNLSATWQLGLYGQNTLAVLLRDLAAVAASAKPKNWRTATSLLPSTLRELALARLDVALGDGKAALQAASTLSEPLRYPAATWHIRAEAYRLIGDESAELQARETYLRYAPNDTDAARRLAWLELKATPFRGLTRLAYQGLPIPPWQARDPLEPLAKTDALNRWIEGLPRTEQNEFCLAVTRALAKIDWPAAGMEIGEAALASLGKEASGELRQAVARLKKEVAASASARPARFIPTDQLAQ